MSKKIVQLKGILNELDPYLPWIQMGVQFGVQLGSELLRQRQQQEYTNLEKHKYDKKCELGHGLIPAMEKAVEKDSGSSVPEVASLFHAIFDDEQK